MSRVQRRDPGPVQWRSRRRGARTIGGDPQERSALQANPRLRIRMETLLPSPGDWLNPCLARV